MTGKDACPTLQNVETLGGGLPSPPVRPCDMFRRSWQAATDMLHLVAMRILLLLALTLPLLAQEADFPINLRQGIMAGEVTGSTAILQSRLTSTSPYQDPRWEGIRGAGGWAYFEIADNPAFRNPSRTEWLEAVPKTDFIVKLKVAALEPATRYHYRLHCGPEKENVHTSETATFRTLAGKDKAAAYSFAIVTGMNYSFFHHVGGGRRPPYDGPDKRLGYPALESILKLAPDFFVGTGDNVYYDHPGHRGRAQTRHELRKKHHEQYSQQRFLDLFPTVGTYWLKDDHDHRFDDSDAVNPVRIRAPKQLRLLPAHQHLRRRIRLRFRARARPRRPCISRAATRRRPRRRQRPHLPHSTRQP